MRKKIKILLILLFTASFSSFAQKEIVINGMQKRTPQGIIFSGTETFIPTKAKISNIKGDVTSFSLYKDGVITYQFHVKNGKITPPPDSIIIEQGKYSIYPDLPPDKDSISLEITIKLIE